MENNKLIAEFMGLPTEVFKSGKVNYYFREFNSGSWYEEHELSYNVSWDWLMPVLKKINEQISPNVCGLWRTITNPYEFSVEEVYLQAVEVINQLNNNNE